MYVDLSGTTMAELGTRSLWENCVTGATLSGTGHTNRKPEAEIGFTGGHDVRLPQEPL